MSKKPIDEVALNKLLVMLVDNQATYAKRINELTKLFVVQSDVIAKMSTVTKDLQKKVAELLSKKSQKPLAKPPTVAKLYN